MERLKPLFMPASVAIVGASATPFKHGNVALKYLQAAGFGGDIYPVNAGGGEIEGFRAYRSILDIPGDVDCALFLIPAAATNAALRECAAKGVRAVIIGSSGFAEQGSDAGLAIQSEMVEIARVHGIAILGPNTNGIWNSSHRLSLGFNTSHGDVMTPGCVSIAAHSGALMNSIAPALRGFGAALCKYVPVGNEANVDLNDIFEFLIGDEDTRVIGLIIEGIADGPRFRDLSKRAREAGKPVVALKLGRSQAGAAAALAHASRLAGSARAYAAFLRGCGVCIADGIESLAGACALLSGGIPKKPEGRPGLVGISTSGGGAELIADHAESAGISLAGDGAGHWPASVDAHFRGIPGSGVIRNPVDAGNLGGVPNIAELLKAIEAEKCNGPVILFAHQLPQEARDLLVAKLMIERRQRTGSPVVCITPGGLRKSVAQFYSENGVPVFRDTKTCFDVLKCYSEADEYNHGNDSAQLLGYEQRRTIESLLDAAGEKALLDEMKSAAILAAAGIRLVDSVEVASSDAAAAKAQSIGGSVVLKCIAPGIAHKNDAGLVAAGLRTVEDIERAWRTMEMNIGSAKLVRTDCQFILQPMLSSRVELIAGLAHEPPLGHFVVAGLGGLLAEALDEVVLVPVPTSREVIAAIIGQSRLGGLLRRLDSSVTRGLLDTLCALQGLALAFPDRIRSVDVNPLLAGNDHCTAVDALIELQPLNTGA